ncbi:unnamed protein product [Amoebophrya sp. A25]|nr:unnamed protein product [Amoebophrya sp. A25]|eukprot:GSA25T00002574001.1
MSSRSSTTRHRTKMCQARCLPSKAHHIFRLAAVTGIFFVSPPLVSAEAPGDSGYDVSSVPEDKLRSAYFAGGCFWGVQSLFDGHWEGVKDVYVGYMGGKSENPTYEEVVSAGKQATAKKQAGGGETDDVHLEAIQIVYDPERVSFGQLTRHFFEIHDPTQVDRQGPDVGVQYASRIWWNDQKELETIRHIVGLLEKKGYKVATTFEKHRASDHKFWHAEDYHQDYYVKNGQEPYCHHHEDRGLAYDRDTGEIVADTVTDDL